MSFDSCFRLQEAFRRREDGLRKKDLDLQTTLINYNKIITVRRTPWHHVQSTSLCFLF